MSANEKTLYGAIKGLAEAVTDTLSVWYVRFHIEKAIDAVLLCSVGVALGVITSAVL